MTHPTRTDHLVGGLHPCHYTASGWAHPDSQGGCSCKDAGLPTQCPREDCQAIPQPGGMTQDGRTIWRCGHGHTGLCVIVKREA